MNVHLVFKQFFNDLRRQKLRSAMTMFGILWGTCSIVLLFAFGKGITRQQLKQQKGMGENIVIFWPGITSREWQGLPLGRNIKFTQDDMKLIRARARTVECISPENGRGLPIKYGEKLTRRSVTGVWPEYGPMRNIIPEIGSRFISEQDMNERRRVLFMGDRLATDVFGDSAAVGRTVLVDGTPFTIIGVMQTKDQNSSYRSQDNRSAYMPLSTYQAMFTERYPDDFVAQAKPEYTGEMMRQEIFEILGARHRFDPEDPSALGVWDTTGSIAFLKNFFAAFRWFLVGMGIATLITGGIGVTNIMNVVLEERTKEIGIKMALGARKSSILLQFVLETLIVTAVGGLLGFLLACGIVSFVPLLGYEEYIGTPSVDVSSGIMVIGLLGLVGFVAGIFPARRAANLQPVQALKLF